MISIVIPCYNQAEFLPDALESAFRQTTQCEIIAVNDGSTDHTQQILESYANSQHFNRLIVINQINKGLASARNTGIMNATSEYVLPLDADDLLLDFCAEELQKVIDETNADIVAPSFKEFGVRNTEVILGANPTLEDFKTANRIGYFSAIKKEALLEVGGYSPRMTWGYEDYALWIDLLKRGKKLVTIPEVLVLYRTKEQSMLTEAVNHHEELVRQIIKDNPSVWHLS